MNSSGIPPLFEIKCHHVFFKFNFFCISNTAFVSDLQLKGRYFFSFFEIFVLLESSRVLGVRKYRIAYPSLLLVSYSRLRMCNVSAVGLRDAYG